MRRFAVVKMTGSVREEEARYDAVKRKTSDNEDSVDTAEIAQMNADAVRVRVSLYCKEHCRAKSWNWRRRAA